MIEWTQNQKGEWVRERSQEPQGLVRLYPNKVKSDTGNVPVAEERMNRFDRFRKDRKKK